MKRWMTLWIAVALGLPLAAESLTYRETSQGKTTTSLVTVTRQDQGGLTWETLTGKEGTTRLGYAADGTLMAVDVEGPEGHWALTAAGDTLKASGTYQGKPVSGTLALKGRLWSLGFDQPLHRSVRQKLTAPLVFLMVNPVQIDKPTEMALTPDGTEVVEGKPALRFKLALTGAMSLFWNAKVWAAPGTGDQVKYVGNKGPGTPDVVLFIDRAP